MKTDFYTKAVLTVIAVCLTVSLLKEFQVIPTAKAATAVAAPAALPAASQSSGVVDVNIVQINGVSFEESSAAYADTRYALSDRRYAILPIRIVSNWDKE